VARSNARIGVDIGGTFTDVVLEAGGRQVTAKVLTTHDAPARAVLDAVRTVTDEAGLTPGSIGAIIHGTTLATNALIERKGAVTALVTTEGFRDVIQMGTESRFEQYDLSIRKPDPLVPRRLRLTVPERVTVQGDVLLPLDEDAVRRAADDAVRAGVESVAVGLMHSYRNPDHEQQVASIFREAAPDIALSLSSDVSPEIREYERFSTTCANAYVKPLMARYLTDLEASLQADGYACPLFLMLSNGGVTTPDVAKEFPVRLVESGPAGGAILAAHLAARGGYDKVLSFDMGGTTAKICLIDDARPQPARNFEVARMYRFKPGSGLPLRIPVIEMVEIGAGGGSIARVDGLKRLTVGPDSAGSDPGPACYALGGEAPTVTDANVVLGRISPAGFAGGSIALEADRAAAAIDRDVAGPLSLATPLGAFGIGEIVDENMANAAREHAAERGKSLGGRTMICFGGGAPLHAARIADKIGIDRIVVPVAAGVGSAVGFLRAPVAYEVARTAYQRLDSFQPGGLNGVLAGMSAEAHRVVLSGAAGAARREERFGYMRYVGQGHEIPVALPVRDLNPDDAPALRAAYDDAYLATYGRLMEGVDVEVVSWTVTVTADVAAAPPEPASAAASEPAPSASRALFDADSGATVDVPVYDRANLAPGAGIDGPCVVAEAQTTTIVPAAFSLRVDPYGNLLLERRR
jgi:N-methylhydantoinase A